MRVKQPKTLRLKLLFFILLCWLLPVSSFFYITISAYKKTVIEKTEVMVKGAMKSAMNLTKQRIDEMITIARQPSYEKSWERAWRAYQRGESQLAEYFKTLNASLKSKYYHSRRIDLYAFYNDGGEKPFCFGSGFNGIYANYMDKVDGVIQEVMAEGSNYPILKVVDNEVYLIRNMYTTTHYEKFGTLVLRINKDFLFDEYQMERLNNLAIIFNEGDEVVRFGTSDVAENGEEIVNQEIQKYTGVRQYTSGATSDKQVYSYLCEDEADNYELGILYLANHKVIYASLYELYRIANFFVICFIPVAIYIFFFLRKQIQRPIQTLMDVAWAIERGKIGAQITDQEMPNREFEYLKRAFNSMSIQVKHLFDSVYCEKLARKDAQIAALQAQINPHFLNNTLEMMNWQARMSGETTISKMIEALGTVLDHNINRNNEQTVYLSEELHCADSYLYIMSMRFGKRLKIERQIDKELLRMQIPLLILQPILENAIMHGVEKVREGMITMHIYQEEECVYLDVINTGKELTEEGLEKIQKILRGEHVENMEGSGKHTSIGIRNVNQRIKLLYGEEYGLSIECHGKMETLSRISLPFYSK